MLIILLTLISLRPFISSLAFPYLNYIYSALFIIFLFSWIIIKKISLSKIACLKYPLLIFCAALIISGIFSVNKSNTFGDIYKYINGLLLLVVTVSLNDKNRARIIRVIVFSCLIISILAIYQYLIGFRHLLTYISAKEINNPFALDYIGRQRIFLPFATPNLLAGYLAMVIPLALMTRDRGWIILSISLALLLTKSLGALLSLFLALSVYFYLGGKPKKKNVIFLLGLLVIIGVIFIIRLSGEKRHLQPIFSTVMRLGYWEDTFRMILARPLTGVGIGNFNLLQSRYAHNSYLQIWAEMGILGIISIFWLIIAVFKSASKNIKDSLNKKETACLLCAYAVFLIHNLVDFSFFMPEISLIWWVILGLLI